MVKNGTPPTVSFKYTKTIGGKSFNQKQVVQDLNINISVSNILCDCHNSKYCYGPVGHVVTGDLNVIKDAKVRVLVEKGPAYREQNHIDWRVTEKLCRKTVAKYKHKWAYKEKIDTRILNEWERNK